MRYRQLSPTGDYIFGNGSNFLADSPQTVAQAVLTRLRLMVREWFLDLSEGLDLDQILGYGTQTTRDRQVQQRILGTPGVTQILSYSSKVSRRDFTVSATIDTLYGQINISEALR